MGQIIDYGTASNTVSRLPSPSIWSDCPVGEMLSHPSKGIYFWDDFQEGGSVGGADATSGSKWYVYVESGSIADAILQSDADGVLMLDQDGTDDDVSTITTGDNITGLFTITDNQTTKFWFEAAFKVSTITDGDLSVFVGLTEEGQAADGKPMGAVGAIGDIDHIGFNIKEADGDSIDFVHTLTGQTDGGTTDIAVVVADTYVRVGLKYEPKDNKVHVFINGVEDITAAVLASASNFPSGQKLALTISIQSGANGADADNLKLDWVRAAQELNA